MKRLFLIPVLLIVAFSCTTPEMLIDENLNEATTPMEVKGRQGWLVNQTLSFGSFQSSKVQRGWTKSYNIPFILEFKGAKEKLGFDLTDENNNLVEVFCLGKVTQKDLPFFDKLFSINLSTKDVFAGTIVLDGAEAWDFIVNNPNQLRSDRRSEGQIRHGDTTIAIREVSKVSGRNALPVEDLGFEFLYHGRVVGAVETINKGRVWISPTLTEEFRIVIAGAAAALLLRSDLEEPLDS